ncbi:ABC transporter ATP-binding protein [Saccharothrix lopnurensis]|uniref:ABC transporter ATP-binding protein n=1 Tax=Saccharothrix lopnurensis TaxID=1670621 RepID=A0ABW1P8K2_9PSEU
MTPLVRITDLTVTYRHARDDTADTALDSVSLDVPEGQVTAVIGESGSGKSTLAHAVVRLLPHNGHIAGGRVEFAGEDVLRRRDEDFRALRGRHIGFVPQDPIASLNPTRTVGAQLREAFTLARSTLSPDEVGARIRQDLHDLGFDDPDAVTGRYPHELSGGMRQRVLVAIAFSQRPELVIADEPTSALDVLVGREVLRAIHTARAKHGTTVVLITHDLALAGRNAQTAVVLHRGEVVESGPIDDVFANPRHDYTRALLASSPRLSRGRVLSVAEVHLRRPNQAVADEAVADEAVADEAAAPPVIELVSVAKRFGTARRGTQAVDDVSLVVPRGTTFALVGESGSGKTTTSRLILGLERPDRGVVRVLGRDVPSLRRAELRALRRDVQVVYQSPFESLNPRLSLRDIIGEPLASFRIGTRAERRARVRELLDLVRLPQSYEDRKPDELSGGQRQRVAIARALAPRPELLVLDEPVSALDATVQARVLDLLVELQRELNLTYFLVTHDLAVVADVAAHVAVMRSGRIVEHGPTSEVVLTPRHDYTQALLAG